MQEWLRDGQERPDDRGTPAGKPYVYVSPRPWGFGFFPVFVLLLFFLALRGLFGEAGGTPAGVTV